MYAFGQNNNNGPPWNHGAPPATGTGGSGLIYREATPKHDIASPSTIDRGDDDDDVYVDGSETSVNKKRNSLRRHRRNESERKRLKKLNDHIYICSSSQKPRHMYRYEGGE